MVKTQRKMLQINKLRCVQVAHCLTKASIASNRNADTTQHVRRRPALRRRSPFLEHFTHRRTVQPPPENPVFSFSGGHAAVDARSRRERGGEESDGEQPTELDIIGDGNTPGGRAPAIHASIGVARWTIPVSGLTTRIGWRASPIGNNKKATRSFGAAGSRSRAQQPTPVGYFAIWLCRPLHGSVPGWRCGTLHC